MSIIKNCIASRQEQCSINFHLLDTHENTLDTQISALTDLAWNCESESAFSAGLHPGGRKHADLKIIHSHYLEMRTAPSIVRKLCTEHVVRYEVDILWLITVFKFC
jgi:hypothetical protein